MPLYYVWENGEITKPLTADECINYLLHTEFPLDHTVDVEERADFQCKNVWNFQVGSY